MRIIKFFMVLLLCFVTTSYVNASASSIYELDSEFSDFIRNNYVKLVINEIEYDYGIVDIDENEFVLCNPFVIYKYKEHNDPVYYYPIKYKGVIKYMISAINEKDENERYPISTERLFINELNMAGYANTDSIIYTHQGSVYIENKYEKRIIGTDTSVSEVDTSEFFEKGFHEKVDIIRNDSNNFKIKHSKQSNKEIKLGATNILNLNNPQQQYGYNMCWASAAATIINHNKGMGLTGFDICNLLGIGYNATGGMNNANTAMQYYGVSYTVHNTHASKAQIKNNIDSNKPMFVKGTNPALDYGHAIVIRGYYNDAQIVYIWDSSYSTFNDCKRSMYYSNAFSSQGVSYDWSGTLCKNWTS